MLGQRILGLDVGSYSAKGVEIVAGWREFELTRVEELVFERTASAEERSRALGEFLRERELLLDHVVAALPAARLTRRHLRLPFTDRRRAAQAIPFEIEESLPLPLEALVVSHELSPAGEEQSDVLVAMTPHGEVRGALEGLAAAAVHPRVLEAGGAVLANLAAPLELQEGARLILDVGHRATTLCALVDGRPLGLHSIPLAGADFTDALAADLGMSFEAAQLHKHARGIFAPTGGPASAGVQKALEALAREISRWLESASGAPLREATPPEVVLVGGSASLPGLDSWLGERLGLPCAPLRVPLGAPEFARLEGAGAPVFAQAAALALRGAGRTRATSMDFRQGEFAYTFDWGDLRRGLGITLGLAALALTLWIVQLGVTLQSQSSRADALESRLSALYAATFADEAPHGDPFAAMESRARTTRELAAHLGVTGSGLSALEVLREISARIPADLEVALDEVKVERFGVEARGYAKDFESVDRVRAELAGYEGFRNVRLTNVVTDPRRGGKSFNVTIRLEDGT
jgi:general secretion pathway protein L